MKTRDELLEALVVERYNGVSWASESAEAARVKTERMPMPLAALIEGDDDDLIRAQRRRQMIADFERSYEREQREAPL